MELEPAGETEALGRKALRVTATARARQRVSPARSRRSVGAPSAGSSIVDAERGVLLGTTAFVGEKPFRKVEATSIELDEPFDDALFAPPSGV